jgi:2-succinyl-6-hydroxy-2,4-cyclohexadiene-1-carboxylate synthase
VTRGQGRSLTLNVERFGARSAGAGTPPLVLLHGFTGNAETWAAFADSIGKARPLVAIDLPGHGGSACPADPAAYGAERTVEAILAVLERLDVGPFALLGYSLGGRVALHLALAAPERLVSLILESASPGIVDPAERAARRQSDEALARLLDQQGIEAFVDRWERVPIFASQASLPTEVRARHRAQRLKNDPRGLAGSLCGIGAGVPVPVRARLGELTMPTLLIVGSLDTRYVALGAEMAAALPAARLQIVPDAGHAVHLEAPEAFARLVLAHLAASPPPAPTPVASHPTSHD